MTTSSCVQIPTAYTSGASSLVPDTFRILALTSYLDFREAAGFFFAGKDIERRNDILAAQYVAVLVNDVVVGVPNDAMRVPLPCINAIGIEPAFDYLPIHGGLPCKNLEKTTPF